MGFGKRLMDTTTQAERRFALVFTVLFILGLNCFIYGFLKYEALKNYFRLAVIAVLAARCAYRVIKKRVDIRFFVMLGLAALSVLLGGVVSMNMAFMLLLLVVLLEIDVQTTSRIAYIVNMAMLLLVLSFLLLGIVENTPFVVSKRYRITFGFVNVNLASTFAYSVLLTFLLSRKKNPAKYALPVIIATAVVYLVTDSRTPYLSTVLLFLAWPAISKLPRKYMRIASAAFILLMFLMPAIWGMPFLGDTKINTILSDRPRYYYGYMQKQSVLNFLIGGSDVTEVDNYYLVQLYGSGVFLYAGIAFVAITGVDTLIRKGAAFEAAFCLSMLLFGQFEGMLIRPEILCVPVFWLLILKNFNISDAKSLVLPVWESAKNIRFLFQKKSVSSEDEIGE